MATSTYMTYLMHGTTADNTTTWSKLVDIKEFPDLGGEPETLETTTLSDAMQTFIEGIQSNESMEFTTNYTKAGYTALEALVGKEEQYAVWFGASNSGGTLTPDGSEGKFSFKGYLRPRVAGAGVNEVREMTINITPSSEITFA